jgi:translation initiation factor IF-2
MITVTQFSAIILKTAKQHLSKLVRSAPRHDDAPAAPPPSTAEIEAPVDAVPATDAAAPAEAASPAETAAPAEAPAAAGPSAEVTFLMQQMSIDEKRAARLVDALGVVGKRLDQVRQVTVVQLEGAPSRAVKVGEFGYLIDMADVGGGRGDRDRGGRGGGRGGRGGGRGGRGGGRPGGRGGPPAGEGEGKEGEVIDLTGPFSMEAAAADRKRAELAERGRGGPGGGRRGGRGGPGGGRGGRSRGPGGGHGGRPQGPGGRPPSLGGGRGGRPHGPGGGSHGPGGGGPGPQAAGGG